MRYVFVGEDIIFPQTVEKPQFCIRQNWGFERIVSKI